jgi:hypothetical protein
MLYVCQHFADFRWDCVLKMIASISCPNYTIPFDDGWDFRQRIRIPAFSSKSAPGKTPMVPIFCVAILVCIWCFRVFEVI